MEDYKNLLSSQYNKLRYAKKLYQNAEGYKREILKAEIKTLEKDYELAKHSVGVIRAAKKNKKIRTHTAELRLSDLKKKNEGQTSIGKKVAYKRASHIDAKITNVILKNDLFNINEKQLKSLNDIFKKTLDYDLKKNIQDIFDAPYNATSGDAYEGMTNIIKEVSEKIKTVDRSAMSESQLTQLENAYETLRGVI